MIHPSVKSLSEVIEYLKAVFPHDVLPVETTLAMYNRKEAHQEVIRHLEMKLSQLDDEIPERIIN